MYSINCSIGQRFIHWKNRERGHPSVLWPFTLLVSLVCWKVGREKWWLIHCVTDLLTVCIEIITQVYFSFVSGFKSVISLVSFFLSPYLALRYLIFTSANSICLFYMYMWYVCCADIWTLTGQILYIYIGYMCVRERQRDLCSIYTVCGHNRLHILQLFIRPNICSWSLW